jgi:hypothetical protein
LFFPAHYVAQLRPLNFTVLGIANNHAFDDESPSCPVQTVEVVRSFGFCPIGLTFEPEVRTINDVTFAVFAVTTFLNPPFPNGKIALAMPNSWSQLLEKITEWARLVDCVAVMIHWGRDYQRTPSQRIYSLTHQLLAAGARIVYGNHPHILWPIEQPSNSSIVCYSLGNFSQVIGCTSSHPLAPIYSKALTSGILSLEIDKTSMRAELHPIRTVHNIEAWLGELGSEYTYWLWDDALFQMWYQSLGARKVRLYSRGELLGSTLRVPISMGDIYALYSV